MPKALYKSLYKYIISCCLIITFSGTFAQTTYYVDNTLGNDSNAGTSENQAWKSINKINISNFIPGDSILLRRGETWRYPLYPPSGDENKRIFIGAYGMGDLPLITLSLNMNNENQWKAKSENVWVCDYTFASDVGNIIFDNELSAGFKKMESKDLLSQDDFYYNLDQDSLYLYSEINPAIKHTVIECALRFNIIDVSNKHYITLDNLALKYGAAHGIGGSNCSNITIQRCEISWIGGGDLDMDGKRRYGNGIEFWSNASDCIVDGNKIWEIYDTGVTNQSHPICVQKNIYYRNNVIWNCGLAALEIWNASEASHTSNIRFENNTCYNMGQGWGNQRPDPMGVFYAEFPNEAQCDSIIIRNNIFANPLRFYYAFQNTDKFNKINMDYNCYWPNNPLDTFLVNYVLSEITLVDDFNEHQNINDINSFFNDPIFANYTLPDLHLLKNSPCINAGEIIENPIDHDGIERPQQNNVDMGAYEYVNPAYYNEERRSTFSIFPNPSSGCFSIKSEYADFNKISIKIYSSDGKLVFNENKINVSNINPGLTPGIYTVQITSFKEKATMILNITP